MCIHYVSRDLFEDVEMCKVIEYKKIYVNIGHLRYIDTGDMNDIFRFFDKRNEELTKKNIRCMNIFRKKHIGTYTYTSM